MKSKGSKLMRVSIEFAERVEQEVQKHNKMISKIVATRIIAKKSGGKTNAKKKIEWNEYM